VDEGSRQIGSVPSEKGLALRTVPCTLVQHVRLSHASEVDGMSVLVDFCLQRGILWSSQNWCGQEESDCLIKTKHCDKLQSCPRNVISAQCSECHCDEIRLSAGKRRE
jgi:hypothetical protein